ncbi:MAG: ImmA/IrrE family metallo-endopeptidase [Ignavibacteria bacterium]|nr:ImmA/IrrE family metallo-endopeptidase [Ignavibacteria bacterium]
MKEKLPINLDVLKWARSSLRLSSEEVAQRLGVSFKVETLEAWEKGEGSPTYPQLERLAHEIYKRPVAVFFFPSVPEEETPKTEFRTLPDTVVDELPAEIIRLYRKAKLFQLYLEELFEGERPVKTSLLDAFELNEKSQFASITKAIRKALGVSIEEQSKWRSAETAFKKWRDVLEATGVFIFKDGFRNDDYSGFCLYHQKYPIIFVNNSMPDSRQVFTLFHELGHLLYRSGGIDFRSREAVRSFQGYYLNVEVSCNRFANEFLVPQEAFDSFEPRISEAHFEKLADYFSVSREVILRNYFDRGLVDADYYEKMAAKWTEQAKEKKEEASGGSYYYSQKAYLGERYINLVYGKYYQNKITVDSVAEYLHVKVKNLPTFENVVMEGGKP